MALIEKLIGGGGGGVEAPSHALVSTLKSNSSTQLQNKLKKAYANCCSREKASNQTNVCSFIWSNWGVLFSRLTLLQIIHAILDRP